MNSFAFLRTESPFFGLFPPTGCVPIKGMIPREVRLESSDERLVYMLDWSRCGPDQRRAIAIIATKLLGGNAGEFIDYMNRGGDMPIRVSQVTGTAQDRRAFV